MKFLYILALLTSVLGTKHLRHNHPNDCIIIDGIVRCIDDEPIYPYDECPEYCLGTLRNIVIPIIDTPPINPINEDTDKINSPLTYNKTIIYGCPIHCLN